MEEPKRIVLDTEYMSPACPPGGFLERLRKLGQGHHSSVARSLQIELESGLALELFISQETGESWFARDAEIKVLSSAAPRNRYSMASHLGRYAETISMLQAAIDLPGQRRILDLGAGAGHITRIVKMISGSKVVAVDLASNIQKSRPLIEHARRMSRSGIPVVFLDLNTDRFPFGKHVFNLVLMTEVIEHLARPRHCLAEVRAVLSPKGFLVLTTPNLLRLGNVARSVLGMEKKTHGKREYHTGELRRMLSEQSFKVLTIRHMFWSERRRMPKSLRELFTIRGVKGVVRYAMVRVAPFLSSYTYLLVKPSKPIPESDATGSMLTPTG